MIPRSLAEESELCATLEGCAQPIRERALEDAIGIKVLRGRLDTEGGTCSCVDLWFLSTDGNEPGYFAKLERVIQAFTRELSLRARNSEEGARGPRASTRAAPISPPISPRSTSALRAFATPRVSRGLDTTLLREARSRRAIRLTSEFLTRFGEQLPPGLYSILARLPDYIEPHRREVHRALNALSVTCNTEGIEPTAAGVRAALWLSTAGIAMDLEVKLPSPTRLSWRGCIFPRCDRIALSAGDKEHLEFSLGAHTSTLDGRALCEDSRVVPLPVIALGRSERSSVNVLMPWTLDACQQLCTSFPLSPLPTADVVTSLMAGVDLLQRAALDYETWCAEAVTDLLPVLGNHAQSMSASLADGPGQLAVSLPAPSCMLAELLVHESSHEHLYLASELEPLDDGSDATLYWSPVKKTGRPSSRILLAHHAFINFLLFFERVMASGLDHDRYAELNTVTHRRAVEELEVGLEATNALTDMGRALYVPLREAFS